MHETPGSIEGWSQVVSGPGPSSGLPFRSLFVPLSPVVEWTKWGFLSPVCRILTVVVFRSGGLLRVERASGGRFGPIVVVPVVVCGSTSLGVEGEDWAGANPQPRVVMVRIGVMRSRGVASSSPPPRSLSSWLSQPHGGWFGLGCGWRCNAPSPICTCKRPNRWIRIRHTSIRLSRPGERTSRVLIIGRESWSVWYARGGWPPLLLPRRRCRSHHPECGMAVPLWVASKCSFNDLNS